MLNTKISMALIYDGGSLVGTIKPVDLNMRTQR